VDSGKFDREQRLIEVQITFQNSRPIVTPLSRAFPGPTSISNCHFRRLGHASAVSIMREERALVDIFKAFDIGQLCPA
jgi:hypothetical protein